MIYVWCILDTIWNLFHRSHCKLMGVRPRSSQWPAFRRAWLRDHPACEVCGNKNSPEPHHIEPFHRCPSKELDVNNLVTLGRSCGHHITFGHCGDFKCINLTAHEDIARWKTKYDRRS